MMNDDMALVREYAVSHSEAAFAKLVDRYLGLVYSVAMRQTGDPGLAQEIAQAVFIVLARKAGSLGGDTILSAWLHRTARFVAADALRARRRRLHHEQEAHVQSLLNKPDDEGAILWNRMAPLLDEALTQLGEKDRTALVLRFFDARSLREVAAGLGVSEEAAKKRVTRALEKLRKLFARRGVVLSAAALVTAISANAAHAAPAGMAGTITTGALTKGVVITGTTASLVKGALKIMAWTKAKSIIATGVAILLAGGVVTCLVFHRAVGNQLAVEIGKYNVARQVATPVDLTSYYQTPASYFAKITNFPAWRTVPIGFQVFDHVPLQIDGMICLWGEMNAQRGLMFPEDSLGIEINRKSETLYVYHGAFFKSPDKSPVCEIVFRYQDGSSLTNQLLYGDDMLNWGVGAKERELAPSGPNSMVAWVGGSFMPKNRAQVRFCLTAIKNPSPSNEVATIDLYSSKGQSAACIMAMTTGRAGLMKK